MPSKRNKAAIWKSILQLILPNRKAFLAVVLISLLSTGVNLVEPLIYREAINDIAGLFVQKAKEDTRKEYDAANDSDEDATAAADSTSTADSTATENVQALDSIGEDAPAVMQAGPPPAKLPHHRSHVAARTRDQAMETLMWAVALLFITGIAGQILKLIGDNMNVRMSCYIEQGFIQQTFAHVLALPLGFFGKRSSGAVAKQINQSEEVSAVVNGLSQEILPEIISLTGILVIMFFQNVTLTLIALSVIPFYLYVAWTSATRLESSIDKYYEQWEEVSARVQDALGGIKTVKLSGAERRETQEFKKLADGAYSDYITRMKKSNSYVFWESMLTRIASALVLGYGGYLTLENRLTPGDVVMFVAYLDRLYDPIDALSSLWVNLQQNIASINRALKLRENSTEKTGGRQLEIKSGDVEFRNVHFSYQPEREILKGVNMRLKPGKVTAIVGGSGAGKTTAVDLLMKLYEPASGQILIDGIPLSDCDPASVRAQMGMVSADGAIFRGSLADNIRYKRPEASDEEVRAAALAAGMEGTLQRLANGQHTPVGENGIGLSVGERQRIQIARVLVSQPKILILDEATANLDFATESEIKKTVEEIRQRHTVVVIAHRFNMVRDADYVFVLSAGQVIEEGMPQQLAQAGGWFSNFAKAAHTETSAPGKPVEKEEDKDENADKTEDEGDTSESDDGSEGDEDNTKNENEA